MKKIWVTTAVFFILIFLAWYLVIKLGQKHIAPNKATEVHTSPLAPSDTHLQYWSRNGRNIMLLGGSIEDNLFQIDHLEEHLDLLKSVGGNYVRNTMSSRDVGNEWAFAKNEKGQYNLNLWNEDYWHRFDHFLKACSERDVIVQIELWATFDFYRENWNVNPFNPKNNINYTAERVQVPTEVKSHPTWTENNFFWSIPSQENNLALLGFQQKYVDKLLSYSLEYDNVIYCMDNETSVTAEWGKFWSLYIKKVANEGGKTIYTTEMWDPWNLDHVTHRETFDHPEIYDFVDISQNNHNSGDVHWENGIKQINRLKSSNMLRPVNNVKVYGNDGGRHQTTQNAIESYVRNVLLGASSVRFHRPPSGQGLNNVAQQVIKSMRSYVEQSDFFDAEPSNDLLHERSENEAFCRAIEGQEYAVYFPANGEVSIDIDMEINNITVKWLDIRSASWSNPADLPVDDKKVTIKTPAGQGNWLAFLIIK